MRVTFYSNFLNHHQLPFCQAMFARLGTGFTFVACEPIHEERRAMGYADMNLSYPFVLRAYESENAFNQARRLACESDMAIVGAAPREFVDIRMKGDQLTFQYSERLFKRGTWRRFVPTTRRKVFNSYTRYRNNNLYVLCASAYMSSDLRLCGFPSDKCLRWGYFPEVRPHDLDVLMRSKEHEVPRILWAGRLLDWKHAEHAIEVGRRLKANGCSFKLDVVGSGPCERGLRERVRANNIEDCVRVSSVEGPEQVRVYMESANIFLFTSSFREGWGAVLNEAMNSGCAVVASHAIGSVPFLLRQEENGLIYEYGDSDDLYLNVHRLLVDRPLCRDLGKSACGTLESLWNASVAAHRLIELTEAIQGRECVDFVNGPCSPAPVLGNDWFRS